MEEKSKEKIRNLTSLYTDEEWERIGDFKAYEHSAQYLQYLSGCIQDEMDIRWKKERWKRQKEKEDSKNAKG